MGHADPGEPDPTKEVFFALIRAWAEGSGKVRNVNGNDREQTEIKHWRWCVGILIEKC